jgi:hypothetical protein
VTNYTFFFSCHKLAIIPLRKFEIFVLRIKGYFTRTKFHGIRLMDEYGSLNSAISGCKIVKETEDREVDANDASCGVKSDSYDVITQTERERTYRGLS